MTHETFKQGVGCVVDGIPVGVMQKGDGNLFIKVIPLVTIILSVCVSEGMRGIELKKVRRMGER